MATHSSILTWRISWTAGPGGLQSMGLQRVRHDEAANTYSSIYPFPYSFPIQVNVEYRMQFPVLCSRSLLPFLGWLISSEVQLPNKDVYCPCWGQYDIWEKENRHLRLTYVEFLKDQEVVLVALLAAESQGVWSSSAMVGYTKGAGTTGGGKLTDRCTPDSGALFSSS